MTVTILSDMAKLPGGRNGVPPSNPQIDWQSELDRHDRWLRMVAFARLHNPDEVDEVMQEIALAAIRQAAPVKDPAKVAPWLYRLAIRQTLLLRRRKGRQRKLMQRYVDGMESLSCSGDTLDALHWLLSDERRLLVRQALTAMPDRDAEILLLKYAQDWSYHEIAEHLGVSHASVESRLHRARGKLRHQLALVEVNQNG